MELYILIMSIFMLLGTGAEISNLNWVQEREDKIVALLVIAIKGFLAGWGFSMIL